jgi:hypothetical protein
LDISIKAIKAVLLSTSLIYTTAAAIQAGTMPVKVQVNSFLRDFQLVPLLPKMSSIDQYVTVDCKEVEEGARDLLPAKI